MQSLGILKQKFPNIPVLALTATATASVKEYVVQALGLVNCVVFRQSFNRPNLLSVNLLKSKYIYIYIYIPECCLPRNLQVFRCSQDEKVPGRYWQIYQGKPFWWMWNYILSFKKWLRESCSKVTGCYLYIKALSCLVHTKNIMFKRRIEFCFRSSVIKQHSTMAV